MNRYTVRFFAVALALALGNCATLAAGAHECNVTIEGGEPIKFKIAGEKGFDYVVSPRDMATGQASGKRMHKPMTIYKEWGAASPQLMRAVAAKQEFKSVLFEFVRAGADGKPEVFQTVKATGVTISSVQKVGYDIKANKRTAQSTGRTAAAQPELEEVTFVFGTIEYWHKDGKTMAKDSWSAN